ncbi:MAG: hypothetical protein KDK78_10800, partial [Chlamydiia bacterium]|nr:hypothetical protein [Chlamydiia bacterium]
MPRRVEIPYRESQPPAPKQQETGRWLSRRFFYDSSPSTWIKTSAVTAFTSALSFGTYLSAQDEDGEDTLTASIGLTTGVLSLAISVGSACLYRLSAQHNPKRAVLNALASKNEDAALLALESLSEGERRDLLTWSRDKLISLIRENNCYKCCAFLLPQ